MPLFLLSRIQSAWNRATYQERLSVLSYVGVGLFCLTAFALGSNEWIGTASAMGVLFGSLLHINRPSSSDKIVSKLPPDSEQREGGNQSN